MKNCVRGPYGDRGGGRGRGARERKGERSLCEGGWGLRWLAEGKKKEEKARIGEEGYWEGVL